MNIVKYCNLGRISYNKSNALQNHLANLHKFSDSPVTKNNQSNKVHSHNTLLLMEHDPVFTTGIREYITPEEEVTLKKLGAEFIRTNRGGLITFHGPGQLTAYSIFNLRHFQPSAKWFVGRLEESIIQTCRRIGIIANRSPYTGVWVNDKKICAIGIHISRGITTHGIGLNCCTDLSWFDHIVPCGIQGKGVTSISRELNKTVTIDDILPLYFESVEEVFDCKLTPYSDEEKITLKMS